MSGDWKRKSVRSRRTWLERIEELGNKKEIVMVVEEMKSLGKKRKFWKILKKRREASLFNS